MVTINSIEHRIALGLLVKQNLFDSVLNDGNNSDFVDFTDKGRGQFLEQMKELADDFENAENDADDAGEEEKKLQSTEDNDVNE